MALESKTKKVSAIEFYYKIKQCKQIYSIGKLVKIFTYRFKNVEYKSHFMNMKSKGLGKINQN